MEHFYGTQWFYLKGPCCNFWWFFNVPNMTFSTFNIKFDIWTNIKVNIFLCKMISWLFSKKLNFGHFKAYYRIYAINTNIWISPMEPNGTIWIFQGRSISPKDNFLLCYTLQANAGFIGFWLIEFHEIIRRKQNKIKDNVKNGPKWLKVGAGT